MRALHRSAETAFIRSFHAVWGDTSLSSQCNLASRCRSLGLGTRSNRVTFSPRARLHDTTKGGGGKPSSMAGVSAPGTKLVPAQDDYIKLGAEALKKGEVVAVPTDTLYGLAADAGSASAIRRLYEIKARQASNPIAICVAEIADVSRYASTEHLPEGLLEALLPGPVTLVLNRLSDGALSDDLNPGVPGIGVRIPDAQFIRALARDFGGALALTSANVSNSTSTVAVDEFRDLWPACEHVFDGGRLQGSREGSTVVDLTKPGGYRILRPGSAFKSTTTLLREKHGLQNLA